MRILYLLILLAGILRPAYALNGKGLVQDSIKQVTIKVTAAEKPKELSFDSLVKSREVTKPVSKPAATKAPSLRARSTVRSSNSKNQTPSQKNSGSLTEQPSKAPSKKAVSPDKSKTTVKSTSADAHEEIAHAEVIDENNIVAPTNDIKASRTYLWIGFMLIVVGVILGILFGKMALLISLAGLVFVIIGYSI